MAGRITLKCPNNGTIVRCRNWEFRPSTGHVWHLCRGAEPVMLFGGRALCTYCNEDVPKVVHVVVKAHNKVVRDSTKEKIVYTKDDETEQEKTQDTSAETSFSSISTATDENVETEETEEKELESSIDRDDSVYETSEKKTTGGLTLEKPAPVKGRITF